MSHRPKGHIFEGLHDLAREHYTSETRRIWGVSMVNKREPLGFGWLVLLATLVAFAVEVVGWSFVRQTFGI